MLTPVLRQSLIISCSSLSGSLPTKLLVVYLLYTRDGVHKLLKSGVATSQAMRRLATMWCEHLHFLVGCSHGVDEA